MNAVENYNMYKFFCNVFILIFFKKKDEKESAEELKWFASKKKEKENDNFGLCVCKWKKHTFFEIGARCDVPRLRIRQTISTRQKFRGVPDLRH